MKFAIAIALTCIIHVVLGEELRVVDLEPTDAQQYIDKQDTTLKYAPKIESNVPAVRFLGNEPHNVVEDIYLANQYHGQDGLGGYLYGYGVPDIAKTERKKAGGDLRGAYQYIAGNGQEIKVEYWDDGHGFHQIDNVPKILPVQIPDTPEVAAAKSEHARIWAEQAERNSKPIANPYAQQALNPNYQPQPQKQVPYGQPQQQISQGYYQQPQVYQTQQTQQQPQQLYQQAAKPQGLYQQPQAYQAQQTQQSTKPAGLYQQPQQYQAQQSQRVQQQTSQQPIASPASGLINQYQQQKQQYPNPGQSVQYQGDQAGQYQAQQTHNSNQYQQQAHQSEGDDSGEYREDNTGEYDAKLYEQDDQGPPRGFFYSFDYPVGIIVNKEGGAIQTREGDVKDVYNQNKALYEQQLQGGVRPARSSNSYLYVPHQ